MATCELCGCSVCNIKVFRHETGKRIEVCWDCFRRKMGSRAQADFSPLVDVLEFELTALELKKEIEHGNN